MIETHIKTYTSLRGGSQYIETYKTRVYDNGSKVTTVERRSIDLPSEVYDKQAKVNASQKGQNIDALS